MSKDIDATPSQTAAAAGAPGHTPGEWSIEDEGEEGASIVNREYIHDGWDVALVYNSPRGKANARLIAAAPDLLELVREMISCLDPRMVEAHDSGALAAFGITHSDDCSLCKARRIIANATGAPQAASETSVTPTPKGVQ